MCASPPSSPRRCTRPSQPRQGPPSSRSRCGAARMTDQSDISPQASAYLKRVLTLAEEQSVRRYQIDWATVRRTAFKSAAGAVHTADVYPAIDAMLVGLDDRHSVLIRPDQMQLIRGGL